ncbi:hypothetical protein JHN59_00525 [Streptomyces sp. MBT49]|uniref:hypothetical protein n=1 Tax=Streptomyces sp. MBT49 TaxID=1488380 RepID=UPI00190E1C01|nr:hypothetical protein [Streptomyces sp. MBT49]MBK3623360.1 hypothetical protein [Streptomyces sp. MBT49]
MITWSRGVVRTVLSRLRPAPALAHLLAGRGAQVAGSALHTGEAAAALEEAGCLDRSVALYRPDVAVVLNADDDHPEVFAGTGDVVGTLTDHAAGPKTLVVCTDDAGAREVTSRSAAKAARTW